MTSQSRQRTVLEPGQLVIAKWPKDRRTLFMVTKVSKAMNRATLLTHRGYGTVEVNTTTAELPDDWQVVDADELIVLVDRG